MIEDVTAYALRVAPCLSEIPTPEQVALAKAVLRGAVLRWNDAGTGEVTQQTSGAFTTTYVQQQRKSLLWPSEIEDLQQICSGAAVGKAFEVDTMPSNAMTGGYWTGPDTWVPFA